MKKKIVKKIITAALLSSVLVSSGTMNVFAKSDESRASAEMGGAFASGCVSTDSASATAETVCPRAATVFTEARVDYWYGSTHYYSVACAGASGGSAAVTASIKKDGAEVTGGMGTHYVSFGSVTWKTRTKTGEVYSDATCL